MSSFSQLKAASFTKFYSLLGIPIISMASGPWHFLYEWSGEMQAVGLFAPINESIWEHLKLGFFPIILWWLFGLLLFGKNKDLSPSRWLIACSVAVSTCLLFIVSYYYTLTGAFNIHSTILDILSLFFGALFAQLLAIHIYKFVVPRLIWRYLSSALFILLVVLFFLFTFSPPDFPLFIPPV